MDFSWRFDRWFRRLPASPKDVGEVRRLVLRPPGEGTGARRVMEEVRVVEGRGVEGDRWFDEERELPDHQVTLVNIHVLESLAGKTEERCALSGDNMQVDLDLTEDNLPAGTRLHVGDAILEVSRVPHMPCGKFHERYGVTAVKKVLRANKVGNRGRGALCTVHKSGTIRVGDAIRVERKSAP